MSDGLMKWISASSSPQYSAILAMCYGIAECLSDDPRTKNGAIIAVMDDRAGNWRALGCGANSVPPGVLPHDVRLRPKSKRYYIEHAERKAIHAAAARGQAVGGATMFCPWAACADCARAIITAGISRLVTHASPSAPPTPKRWLGTISVGRQMLLEAGVEIVAVCGCLGCGKIAMRDGVWFSP